MTVSLVGSEAVKYCGSGFGNAGAATGAGAAGVCAGAAGTCVCAEAFIRNRDIATSTAALANRTDGRIKLFLLISRESSQILAYTPTSTLGLYPDIGGYTCTLTAMGNLRPIPNDLRVTFSTGAACWRLYSDRSTSRTTCWTSVSGNPFCSEIRSGVS